MNFDFCSRRDFMKIIAGSAAAASLGEMFPSLAQAELASQVPMRVVTQGPKHHWFGYYDKLEFDPTQRYLLSMEVDFEHRSPTPEDEITIGMIDLEDNDRWIPIGKTTAWGWQQGCMFQWIPGSKSKVIWNARGENNYISHIKDVFSGETKSIDSPIYTVSPTGKSAVTADFRRINDVRPGYGYTGFPDPFAEDLAPSDTGIFHIDLDSGETKMIISLEQIANMGTIPDQQPGIKHYFNHLLYNTDGSRFVFLHRWRYPNGSRKTRMITAKDDGTDIRIIDDNGMTSHFDWRDPNHILAWSDHEPLGRRFYLFEDANDGAITPVGEDVMKRDGHCTYLPDTDWILNDTYPDKNREQSIFLYHVPTGKTHEIGKVPSPKVYTGEWRCDTHPRHSPDGKLIVVDSPYKDQGRQLYLFDISGIVE
ncbi:hypothetical protein [Polystyrenella longa]|nr:hypothetical protein [Polystyrenella longa]